ncbi:MAG: hypothetical protein ACREEM_42090 [Blastocatellia bacterium]
MRDRLFGTRGLRQRDRVGSDNDVAAQIQPIDRGQHGSQHDISVTRTENADDFARRQAGMPLRQSLFKKGDDRGIQSVRRIVRFWRSRFATQLVDAQQTDTNGDHP